MRSPTNRRLYTDADIDRLRLLRQATAAGHSIGHIARLPKEQLETLISDDEAARSELRLDLRLGVDETSVQPYLFEALEAVKALDSQRLESVLNRAALALSRKVLLESLVVQLAVKVGELWREGSLRVAHEHAATATLRTFLGRLEHPQTNSAPIIVSTTPAGQLHELGALMAGASAAADGWRVVFLGPNLPADEIAAAADQIRARVVVLSIVYPPDDPHLAEELRDLRRYLPDEVDLVVGGRSAASYDRVLEEIGALRLPEMESLRAHLESLRAEMSPS